MAVSPSFAATPRIGGVVLTALDSSLTNPTTSVSTLLTGASTGTRVAEIIAKISISSTSTASVVRVFLFDGTTYYLFDEISLTSVAPTGSTGTSRTSVSYNNLILPNASWSVRVTTNVAQSTTVTALGADL